MWKKGLPPLFCGGGDESDAADPPQQLEKHRLLDDGSPGLRQVDEGKPSFPIHAPNQDGNDVTGKHTERNEGSGDYEEHPRESHGGEADSTQEAFSHFSVHGRESHTRQGHREQPPGVMVVAVTLQEVQEAVEQARDDRQHGKEEEEADSTKTFL